MGEWWDTDIDDLPADELGRLAILWGIESAGHFERRGQPARVAEIMAGVRAMIGRLDPAMRADLERRLGLGRVSAVAGYVKIRKQREV